MPQQFRDVEQFIAKPAGTDHDQTTKATLLKDFRAALLNKVLYRKRGRRYVQVLPNDLLSVEGYFLTKHTLERLLTALGTQDGYVLVNFALGESPEKMKELQLVLTAARTDENMKDDDLGLLCLTTAPLGNPTDPPLTGDPHPKPRGGRVDNE